MLALVWTDTSQMGSGFSEGRVPRRPFAALSGFFRTDNALIAKAAALVLGDSVVPAFYCVLAKVGQGSTSGVWLAGVGLLLGYGRLLL